MGWSLLSGAAPRASPVTTDALVLSGDLLVEAWEIVSPSERRLVQRQFIPNLVVQNGRNLVRDLLNWNTSSTATQPLGLKFFAVGTASSGYVASASSMGNEIYRGYFSTTNTAAGQLMVKYQLPTNAATSNPTLREAALWGGAGASSGIGTGTLYCGTVYAGIAKTTSLAVTYTWNLYFSTSSTGSTA